MNPCSAGLSYSIRACRYCSPHALSTDHSTKKKNRPERGRTLAGRRRQIRDTELRTQLGDDMGPLLGRGLG